MKKIFTTMAAVMAVFAMTAQVNSTFVQLRPSTYESTDANGAWVFNGGYSLSNDGGKTYASVANYNDKTTDTLDIELLKISKDKTFTINVPEDQAVVRIQFYGVSNSSSLNWAYLYMINNTVDLPIFTESAYDIMDNDTIQAKCEYPISPMVNAAKKPFATFSDKQGWFSKINFYIDGNNQVAINISLWTVPATQIESYDPATDKTLTGINSVKMDDKDAPAYNLKGQLVTDDYQGIIIKNGKKYLNK